jgi:hypothetical protein
MYCIDHGVGDHCGEQSDRGKPRPPGQMRIPDRGDHPSPERAERRGDVHGIARHVGGRPPDSIDRNLAYKLGDAFPFSKRVRDQPEPLDRLARHRFGG